MRTVFLSYCSKDKEIADIVENGLLTRLGERIIISRYTRNVQYRDSFKSFMELLKVFSTEKKCENFLKKVRWGNEVVSPYDNTAKVYKCSRNRFRCATTGKDFKITF